MENKTDFFERNIKKIVKIDLKLQEQNIDINVKVTGAETIPFFIDLENQLLVIDGYFQNLKTFWDTTNIQILAQKIKNEFDINDIDEYQFYFFKKNEIEKRNSNSTKIIKYKFDLE